MISPDLLNLLCCPESHQPVRPATPEELDDLNRRIAAREVVKRDGSPVESPLEGGLIREDGRILYPITQNIPVMLIQEAIVLPGSAGPSGVSSPAAHEV